MTYRLSEVPVRVVFFRVGEAESGIKHWVVHSVVNQPIRLWIKTLRTEKNARDQI